ncbi:MAG: NAD(P)-dependent oxidoreductase [Alphaproteobacteria bacterium]|nr:NAD(P)-dependent oxidoreductase [Alphaproteobacteria bacterium]
MAFYGVGVMGAPLAGRLCTAGYAVTVHDSRSERVEAWRQRFSGAQDDAAPSTIVVTCVTDEVALLALLFGADGLIRQCGPGTLFIDHTTASPTTARRIAAAAEAVGSEAVDAPLSGGREGAESGHLSAMMGGSDHAVTQASPIIGCYASQLTHLGPPGAGQLAKLANQIAIAGTVRGLCEAVALARAEGIAEGPLLAALAAGSAHSVQLKRLSGELARPGNTFPVLARWLAKDLALALTESRRLNVALPATDLIANLLTDP